MKDGNMIKAKAKIYTECLSRYKCNTLGGKQLSGTATRQQLTPRDRSLHCVRS